jgi:excisionase family DNA binding protein
MADLAASVNAQLNTVDETLQRLRICRATGYRLINSGALRTVKIGRRRLVPESAIADFIAGLESA